MQMTSPASYHNPSTCMYCTAKMLYCREESREKKREFDRVMCTCTLRPNYLLSSPLISQQKYDILTYLAWTAPCDFATALLDYFHLPSMMLLFEIHPFPHHLSDRAVPAHVFYGIKLLVMDDRQDDDKHQSGVNSVSMVFTLYSVQRHWMSWAWSRTKARRTCYSSHMIACMILHTYTFGIDRLLCRYLLVCSFGDAHLQWHPGALVCSQSQRGRLAMSVGLS